MIRRCMEMFGFELTDYDRKVYKEFLKDFLPDKMIDIHTHVWKKELARQGASNGGAAWPARVADECTVEDLMQTYKDLFPGKKVTPVIFGSCDHNISQVNRYAMESGKKYNLPYFYRTSYDIDPETLEKEVVEGGFKGLKPYLSNKPEYIPDGEIRIFDFLPHEHLKIADKHGLIVILHIARGERLRDRVNIAQLMEIEEKYPNVKLVVAHIGRAYAESDIGNAFETLKKTENMMFDFSANTLDTAMMRCIEAVGPNRVLFGSDMPISKMRMYRIVENGKYINVVPRSMYGDVSGDSHMRETDETDVTSFIYEELLAFRRAAEKLGLSKNDVENITCKNAERILGL
ncbi:MAG: amidohydrolase family protein [Bacillota bacterium]|nr:amidohydrolase family protein [Bacillota bacterium]